MSKICNTCCKEKDIKEYHKRKSSKDGYRNTCKICVKDWQEPKKEYYENQRKEYRENNREKINDLSKDWYQRNKDRKLKSGQQWRKNNPEKAKAIATRANRNKSKDQIRQSNLDRRARVKNLPNTMPKNWWSEMLDFYGPYCQNPECEKDISEFNSLSHDHIIPASWPESTHSLLNSQILCASCNASKNGHRDTDYRDWSKGILLDDLSIICDKINQ